MTHEDAVARCAHLNEAAEDERRWFPKRTEGDDWEIVAITVDGFSNPHPLKAVIEAKPKPSDPPDPRPAIFRTIPPFIV